ncbi:MAG: hypothetical protein QOC71_828 [Thermoplasmata archaeon]|nr:hypothetical protein [Thermoplasmata archaeon]
MGPDAYAMTPEQATETIASVRDYRQALTARAAGTLWLVWGLAMAGIAMLDVIIAPTIQVDPSTLEPGWNVQEHGWVYMLLPVTMLLGAVLATNATWKAHALEMRSRHRPWVAWLVAIGLVAAVAVVGLIAIALALTITDPSPAPGQPAFENTYVFVTPVLSGGAALVLAVLLRRRVTPWPGLAAGIVLLAWMAVAPFALGGTLSDQVANAGIVHVVLCMATLGAVGLLHFRRG